MLFNVIAISSLLSSICAYPINLKALDSSTETIPQSPTLVSSVIVVKRLSTGPISALPILPSTPKLDTEYTGPPSSIPAPQTLPASTNNATNPPIAASPEVDSDLTRSSASISSTPPASLLANSPKLPVSNILVGDKKSSGSFAGSQRIIKTTTTTSSSSNGELGKSSSVTTTSTNGGPEVITKQTTGQAPSQKDQRIAPSSASMGTGSSTQVLRGDKPQANLAPENYSKMSQKGRQDSNMALQF